MTSFVNIWQWIFKFTIHPRQALETFVVVIVLLFVCLFFCSLLCWKQFQRKKHSSRQGGKSREWVSERERDNPSEIKNTDYSKSCVFVWRILFILWFRKWQLVEWRTIEWVNDWSFYLKWSKRQQHSIKIPQENDSRQQTKKKPFPHIFWVLSFHGQYIIQNKIYIHPSFGISTKKINKYHQLNNWLHRRTH